MSFEENRESFLAKTNKLVDDGIAELIESGAIRALAAAKGNYAALSDSFRAQFELFRRMIRARVLNSYQNGRERGKEERAPMKTATHSR